ncbi:MAG: zinc ribbon domain-containing protein [Vicinamibacterales bacterium]
MHVDLERLIALQRIDSAAADARRRIADEPERQRTLDQRIESSRAQVAGARQQLADSQAARREIEKELAVHQGRLSKYRDQLMAVKTNVEYQAMQKEIEHAQTGVKTFEDQILEKMLEGDDLTAAVKRAETDAAAVEKAVAADRKTLATEMTDLNARVAALAEERAGIVGALDRGVLRIFELVSKRRNGVGVAEARDGICTICHVRLRPQVFNTIRRNEQIIQCDSCQRILYFVPQSAASASEVGQPAS